MDNVKMIICLKIWNNSQKKGNCFICDIDDIKEFMCYEEVGETFTIEIIEMTEEDFYKKCQTIHEFNGF